MIDVNFDFTSDVPGYWDGYWNSYDGIGYSPKDPDSKSQTMRDYHRLLWSKPLPNGEVMELEDGKKKYYLKWKDFHLGSDSITVSFRHTSNRKLLDEVATIVPDYHAFVENYIRKMYTIGGEIIFPQARWSVNTARGCHPRIKDRWDLTLGCIRKHYLGQDNPLAKVLNQEQAFFDLFVDFKGYVDFFFLQDCVSEDYKKVNLWLPEGVLIPRNAHEYIQFIETELDFVAKRNRRIELSTF